MDSAATDGTMRRPRRMGAESTTSVAACSVAAPTERTAGREGTLAPVVGACGMTFAAHVPPAEAEADADAAAAASLAGPNTAGPGTPDPHADGRTLTAGAVAVVDGWVLTAALGGRR